MKTQTEIKQGCENKIYLHYLLPQSRSKCSEIKALNQYLENLDEEQLERFTNIINIGVENG